MLGSVRAQAEAPPTQAQRTQIAQVAQALAGTPCVAQGTYKFSEVELPASLVRIAMPTLLERSRTEVAKQGGEVRAGAATKQPAGFWLSFHKGGSLNFMALQPWKGKYAMMGCQLTE